MTMPRRFWGLALMTLGALAAQLSSLWLPRRAEILAGYLGSMLAGAIILMWEQRTTARNVRLRRFAVVLLLFGAGAALIWVVVTGQGGLT